VTEAEEEPEPLVLDDSIYQSKRVTSTKYTQPILDIP
jgi:outer membrane receptor for monomeric catechols